MKLYDMLHFQGHLWTIIDLGKMQGSSIATLLLNDSCNKKTFDTKSPGRYYGSSTEEYLRDFQMNGFKPLITDIDDEGCQGRLYLLSVEEAKKLPQNVIRFKKSWWLRTIGSMYGFQSYVTADGNIRNDANKVYDVHVIRPAMRVMVSDVKTLGGIIIPSFDIANQDWSVE